MSYPNSFHVYVKQQPWFGSDPFDNGSGCQETDQVGVDTTDVALRQRGSIDISRREQQ